MCDSSTQCSKNMTRQMSTQFMCVIPSHTSLPINCINRCNSSCHHYHLQCVCVSPWCTVYPPPLMSASTNRSSGTTQKQHLHQGHNIFTQSVHTQTPLTTMPIHQQPSGFALFLFRHLSWYLYRCRHHERHHHRHRHRCQHSRTQSQAH